MITIVDYGVGNIASLVNMLDFLGYDAQVSQQPSDVRNAQKLILPGIGAFDKAMRTLKERNLIQSLLDAATSGTNILGVCLGMQLLAKTSEEGECCGLGLIDADVVRIDPCGDTDLKVPHMGWAYLTAPTPNAIFPEGTGTERFYFAHSYYMRCAEPSDVAAQIDYGSALCVAVSRGNVHGAQFHPEKSHKFGMRFLKTFAEL
jgi:imidazole glycerol-phosphate synthase subunit HisH